eukprot:3823985-Rhodomonas_salina.1
MAADSSKASNLIAEIRDSLSKIGQTLGQPSSNAIAKVPDGEHTGGVRRSLTPGSTGPQRGDHEMLEDQAPSRMGGPPSRLPQHGGTAQPEQRTNVGVLEDTVRALQRELEEAKEASREHVPLLERIEVHLRSRRKD